MTKGIIYKITNKVNGKIYIGWTAKELDERWESHLKRAKFQKGFALHGALRKYGEQNFEIIEIDRAISIDDAKFKEKKWIAELNCKCPIGYNLTDGGDGANGYEFTEEALRKLSKSHIGQQAWNKGKPWSEECKKKMSDARKGRKLSAESIDKRAETRRKNGWYTKCDGNHHRNMASLAHKGKKLSQEEINKRTNTRLANNGGKY